MPFSFISSTRLLSYGVGVALMGCAATPLHGQTTQQHQPGPVITLPQVTVQEARENYPINRATTATKIEAPLMDIPQSIQVVPRQVIEDQRAVNLSDVLRNVSGFSPSVNSQSQRFSERDAIFRGFSGNNYYTNGFKDPFNGSSFSAGLANIERVEVLKGRLLFSMDSATPAPPSIYLPNSPYPSRMRAAK
jgi:iron complex outermembrane recepter protein